jgi:oxidase EvaA
VPRDVEWVLEWLAERRTRNPFTVVTIPFDRLAGWHFDPETDHLAHREGRFFAVEGVDVRTDHGVARHWRQPIVNQQDVAILGILATRIDGVLHFLMQAKMEPGNVNVVQLSPTVQATSSNYLRAHRGAPSRYVEHFLDPEPGSVLVDVLQSEQGSWFRGKRNRNVVVELPGPPPAHDDFVWLTLGQLHASLAVPNVVNMDARTVLSCLLAGASAACPGAAGSWLTRHKSAHFLTTTPIRLDRVTGWRRDGERISRPDGRFFGIVGVRVEATNREVGSWCQPLLEPASPGLAAFLVRRREGVPQVLARADLRPGYRDVVELGPTVQCAPASVVDGARPRFLDDVLAAGADVRYDVVQSEEGGRFRHAVTRHVLVEAPDAPEPPGFRWLDVAAVAALARSSYQVNIEARSLLLCLSAQYPAR